MDLALGDSIALGTGQAMRITTVARIGASSCWIAKHVPSVQFSTVVISAGVNDGNSKHCIREIREQLKAERVVWIRPVMYAGDEVDAVAKEYGDTVVTYTVGKDRVHPKDYNEIARAVRKETQ